MRQKYQYDANEMKVKALCKYVITIKEYDKYIQIEKISSVFFWEKRFNPLRICVSQYFYDILQLDHFANNVSVKSIQDRLDNKFLDFILSEENEFPIDSMISFQKENQILKFQGIHFTGDEIVTNGERTIKGIAKIIKNADKDNQDDNIINSYNSQSNGIAHDMKNQLMSISAMASSIRNISSDNEIKRLAVTIKEGANNCNYLLDKIKEPKPQDDEDCSLINIHALIIKIMLAFTNIEVKYNLDAKHPLVYVQKHLINNVLLNIVTNANHAIEGNGKIILTTYNQSPHENYICSESQWLYIKIEDDGCGINENIIDHIFEPFFTTKDNGDGLGLPMSLQAIKKHGGTLSVDSKEGDGATFIIGLPIHMC